MFAKLLMVAGALLFAVGALLLLFPEVPWLGRLPGDLRIERGGFRIYLPITSCLLLSAILTLLAWLWQRLR